MSTSTYALPVKTAILPESNKHERRKVSMQSSTIRSPSGSVRSNAIGIGKAGTTLSANGQHVHDHHANSQHARRTSASNNVLGIDGAMRWDSKGTVVGPAPAPAAKGDRHRRGLSDLGRRLLNFPLQTTFPNSPMSPRTPLSAKPNTVFDEIFNGILLPLPFLAASLAFPSEHSPFAGPARSPLDAVVQDTAEMMEDLHRHQHFVQAGALSAAALLLIGTIARIRLSDTPLDRRKGATSTPKRKNGRPLLSAIRSFITRTLSIALPFYASVQLGGVRVALILLVTIASGLSNTGVNSKASILNRLYARKEVVLFLVVLLGVDMAGLLGHYAMLDLVLGYLSLLTSAFAISPPIPYLDRLLGRHMPILTSPTPTSSAGPTPPSTPRWPSGSPRKDTQPSKIADANTSIAAGTTLAIVTALSSYSLAIPLQLSPIHFSFSVLAMIAMSGLTFFAWPVTIGAKGKPGLAVGLAVTATFAYIQSHQIFGFTWIPLFFAAFCIAGYFVALQFSAPDFGHFKETNRTKNGETHSVFTAYLLSYCAPGSMLDTILSEKDSRRIAYFACLNLAFMLVQFFYGFVTGSLGLLTDSIHMLFDCLGLAVGLAAAVMSKWPPSLAFPYGYGKVDTLSGFANGIFLILVSVEIMLDAMHRLHEGHELRRLNELLIVSILGFLVNMVGLTVFGHAHHGHDHGHSHSHKHEDKHEHTHADGAHTHEHAREHDHENKHDHHDHSQCNGHAKHEPAQPSPYADMPPTPFSIPSLPLTPNPPSPTKTAHTHNHDNENMQGIFLHIMADALGSVAVIFSTLLTKYDGWSGWDPLASCGIALLIFLSAIPLVKSSGKKLMLGLPSEVEYSCRDALQGLGELRGVVGYAGVRIWLQDKSVDDSHGNGHDHAHDHDHQHHDEAATMTGVIHVVAAHGVELKDVAERSSLYLKGRGMDLLVHVERGGSNCWCGGGGGTRVS